MRENIIKLLQEATVTTEFKKLYRCAILPGHLVYATQRSFLHSLLQHMVTESLLSMEGLVVAHWS